MRLFLGNEEYFSVEKYANAIMEYAAENTEGYISIYVYATDEDRACKVNSIGGFVPYKPYSNKQICEGLRLLSGYVSL